MVVLTIGIVKLIHINAWAGICMFLYQEITMFLILHTFCL